MSNRQRAGSQKKEGRIRDCLSELGSDHENGRGDETEKVGSIPAALANS